MARTRARARGRYGGEAEPFAYLPESVLQHPAMTALPFAARSVLTALVCGKPRERNGLMVLTDARAKLFGIGRSHATLSRSMRVLREHGLVIVTRRVQRCKRFATEHAVTWWPVYYRDGQPLAQPEPASHAYRQWIAPTIGVKRRLSGKAATLSNTPTIGANHPHHRGTKEPSSPLKPDPKAVSSPPPVGTSNILERGRGLQKPSAARDPTPVAQRIEAARELIRTIPDVRDAELQRIAGLSAEQVKALRPTPASDDRASEAIP